MNTTTPRSFLTFSAFVVTLMLTSMVSAKTPVMPVEPAQTGALASYIFVCRDNHGNLDRRACHHMGRLDPQRVTIAMR